MELLVLSLVLSLIGGVLAEVVDVETSVGVVSVLGSLLQSFLVVEVHPLEGFHDIWHLSVESRVIRSLFATVVESGHLLLLGLFDWNGLELRRSGVSDFFVAVNQGVHHVGGVHLRPELVLSQEVLSHDGLSFRHHLGLLCPSLHLDLLDLAGGVRVVGLIQMGGAHFTFTNLNFNL